MKNILFACLCLCMGSSANAWYFDAPASMKFTNRCLWVNENHDLAVKVVKEFTSSHCETNYATVKGVRFYREGRRECIATTGKAVTLSVRGRGKEVYRVKKPVTACFNPR